MDTLLFKFNTDCQDNLVVLKVKDNGSVFDGVVLINKTEHKFFKQFEYIQQFNTEVFVPYTGKIIICNTDDVKFPMLITNINGDYFIQISSKKIFPIYKSSVKHINTNIYKKVKHSVILQNTIKGTYK